MRVIENGTDTLQWLLADHLGSTSVTASDDGTLNSILKYSAFGEIWASNGVTNTDYLYTNQLSQAEIGLYYYNARWYDPQLGRFVQADTIVPGAGNSGAWDRYAYVINNPINNIDPSGHDYSRGCPVLIDGEYCSPNYLPSTKIDSSEKNEVNQSLLTTWSPVTGIGGSQVYNFYIDLYNNKHGWWWEAFPNFTIWNFLSLLVYFEASGHSDWVGLMSEGGVRWYYEAVKYNKAFSANGAGSIEGVLNWWAAYSQSTSRLYKSYFKTTNYQIPKDYGSVDNFIIFGNAFMNTPDEWKNGFDETRPFGWANLSKWYDEFDDPGPHRDLLLANESALYVIYGNGDSTFIIPSGCAWANGYWLRTYTCGKVTP